MTYRGIPLRIAPALCLLSLVPIAGAAAAAETELVSVRSNGTSADGQSDYVAISGTGKFVAFESSATNLVRNDDNESKDVFVRNRDTGVVRRVSVTSGGAEREGHSGRPAISSDGDVVAFASEAPLAGQDAPATWDVFIHQRSTGKTRRISRGLGGAQPNGFSLAPRISGSGRFIVFHSSASNLVSNDQNDAEDVFVYDRVAKTLERASLRTNGAEAHGESTYGSISSNGRYVVFQSGAADLVSNDGNAFRDVFLHDTTTGRTKLVSLNSNGVQANDSSGQAIVSDNGQFIAFVSDATNLAPNDPNAFADRVFVRDRINGRTEVVSVPPIRTYPLAADT